MKKPKYGVYDLVAFYVFDKCDNIRYFPGTIISVNIPSDDKDKVTYDMLVCDPRLSNGDITVLKGLDEKLIIDPLLTILNKCNKTPSRDFVKVISGMTKDKETKLLLNNNGELSVRNG